MKIINISKSNDCNEYAVEYIRHEQKYIATIQLKLTSFNNEKVNDSFYDCTSKINWLNITEDVIWLNSDEFFIPLKTNINALETMDRIFSIAIIRYYIENHYDSSFSLDVNVLNTNDTDFDIFEFRDTFINYTK